MKKAKSNNPQFWRASMKRKHCIICSKLKRKIFFPGGGPICSSCDKEVQAQIKAEQKRTAVPVIKTSPVDIDAAWAAIRAHYLR